MLGALFDSPSIYFTLPGVLGLVFLLAKTGLAVVGLGGHDAGGVDVGTGADAHNHMGGAGFGLLSVQSGMAFLMGFGWAGLLALHTLHWPIGGAIGLGAGVGAALMFLQGMLWRAMFGLQSSGNIEIGQTAGKEGVVYVQIPASGLGQGQVRLIIDGRQRLFNAVTKHGAEVTSRTRVRVVHVNDDNTVTVEPVSG